MMQLADHRDSGHPPLLVWFDVTFIRRVTIQRQVSPRIMVVFEVRPKDPLQISLVEPDDGRRHSRVVEPMASTILANVQASPSS